MEIETRLLLFKKEKDHCLGDLSGEATPVPIPNTAVKLSSADDSVIAKVGRRQDNGLFYFHPSQFDVCGGLCYCMNSFIRKRRGPTMSKELIKKTAEYVKLKLYNNPSGHDWYHVERVWKMAQRLQAAEGGDLEVIELSALLHNLGDHSDLQFQPEKGSLILYGMMDVLEIEEPVKTKVLTIIDEMKFGGHETRRPVSLEGKIAQDANFLDTFGAIGVARQLASGGYHGRPIYDPEIGVRHRLSRREYQFQKKKGTSINNFYEKALRVVQLMNTAAAKRIAERKIKFVEKFLEQFEKEWSEFEEM